MDVKTKNSFLLQGQTTIPGLFPHIDALAKQPVVFEAEFGLDALPDEPGFLSIRGARQLGKSTWLERVLKAWIEKRGPRSAFYLNGDEILDQEHLAKEICDALAFLGENPCLFIDEITAIPDWEKAIKRLYDQGATRHVLIVTTGSKAVDLKRGVERLPGRKGRITRTSYLFLPISYRQFREKCQGIQEPLVTYLLTGGSPLAINEYLREGLLPEYLISLVRDWILGECAAQRRSRNILTWLAQALLARGGSPVPLEQLARETGAANNTVLRGYVDLLEDLLCVETAYPIDLNRNLPSLRKAQKYHWINTLAAVAFHPAAIRSVKDFLELPPQEQGRWLEWLVAQELWRRKALAGQEAETLSYFFQTSNHELDFRQDRSTWIEVKRGKISPIEFAWFPKVFATQKLTVICQESWKHDWMQAMHFEEFLLNEKKERA